jgi:O-antigen ligase
VINRDWLQRGLNHNSPWVRLAMLLALCFTAALPVGAAIGLLGGTYGSALIIALASAYLMLRSLTFGLIALVSIICLLPFAAIPINIGFSPTFLDLALVAVFFVWISRVVTLKDRSFMASTPTGGVLIFAGLAMVSFILGMAHAPLTANVLRHFAEIMMSILIFVLVINAVRTRQQVQILVGALMVAGFVAALIGVVLYALPDRLTMAILSRLAVVRYPSGSDVLRYIEDNPELPLRATSTSVDPNVLGGMLIFVTTLTAAQTFAERPMFPRRLLAVMLVTMGACMVLSFSRGSFAGLAVALGLMALLRYPKLIWMGLLGLLLMLLLPPTQAYVAHFLRGVRGEDLATQMRYGEYKDAFILIRRYPWFGVGFAGTPDIDTYLGVSSVYLLIAEEMGLIGLTAFVGTLVTFLANGARWLLRRVAPPEMDPLILGTHLAVVGGMVGGALDHYLFNLDFPHAAALMWLVAGLGSAAVRLAQEAQKPALASIGSQTTQPGRAQGPGHLGLPARTK